MASTPDRTANYRQPRLATVSDQTDTPPMDSTDVLTATATIIRAHQRRSLDPNCRCSPTLSSTHDTAIHWSPTHLAEALANAGLLAQQLPLNLDDTGPMRLPGSHADGLSDPRGTLTP